MSQLTIEVRFLAGTDIKDAIIEAKERAIAWNVAYVCFNFNNVRFSIGQNADIDYVQAQWEEKKDSIVSA